MINFKGHRLALAKIRQDTCSIYRSQKKKVNGETVRDWVIIKSLIPCRFSQSQVPKPNQTMSVNLIETDYKIFFDPDVEVLAGDRFNIVHAGRTYVMYGAGEPAVYQSHQEVRLQKENQFA